MKKFLFSLMLAVICSVSAFAERPTGKALTFQNQTMEYLKNEGYVPQIDSDGDLMFKSEGKTIYVDYTNFGPGVYMDMYCLVGIEDSNMSKLRRAADEAQGGLKFVRIDFISEDTVAITIKQYLSNMEDFKENGTFFVRILLDCNKKLRELYNN